jgi:Na+-driven multidrug efflux pump
MMVYMPIGGFADGLQPIVSVNYGSENISRLKETIKLAILYSLTYIILASICGFLFGNRIIELFGGDKSLLMITKHGLNIILIFWQKYWQLHWPYLSW